MVLIDTHCHLYLPEFAADLAAVLERAVHNQVQAMIVVGIDAETSRQAVQMAQQYESVYAAVGIHPNSQVQEIEVELSLIQSWLSHPKVVAVGEIGLDYYRKFVSVSDQKYRLQRQLEYAAEAGLPVILHNRHATDDLMSIISEWAKAQSTKFQSDKHRLGVFHSFSEDDQVALQMIQMGFLIGVSGVVTFANAHKIKDAVRSLPLSHLLIETDAPYLCPHPFRGKRNEPAYLTYTLREIATLQGISEDTVAEATTKNAQTVFGIG